MCALVLQLVAPHLARADSVKKPSKVEASGGGRHARGFVPDPVGYENTEAVQAFRDYLPPKYDLSADLPPPGNQGDQGSCVAWAVGYAARTYYLKHYYAIDVSKKDNQISPAFIYNRLKETGGDCENGVQLPAALKLLQTSGGVPLSVLPYDANQCLTLPTQQQLSQYGDRFRIRGFRKVKDEDDVKGEIYRDNPVIFAIDAEGKAWDHYHSGIIDTTEGGCAACGHAMVIVGYDDEKQAFHFVNSWGTAWGEKGFGWLSYRSAKALWIEGYVMDVEPPANPPAPAPAPPPQPVPQAFVDPPRIDSTAPCSRTSATEVRSGSGFAVTLIGFVGKAQDLQDIRDSVLKQPGVSGVDSDQVALRPWPQCEALLTLDNALANSHGMIVTKTPDKMQFVRGEEFSFAVRSPDYPSYLYVAYVQADGSAKFLLRPTGSGLTPPNTVFRLGEGPKTVHYKVAPPFGSEMVVALASDHPLLGEDLPVHDRQLLTAYRRVLPHAHIASAAIVTLDTSKQ
jgi:hypothetical protein